MACGSLRASGVSLMLLARARLRDLGEHGALLRREALHGLDEVGNEVGAPLVDVLDLRPFFVDVLLEADEPVLDADRPDHDADDEHDHHRERDETGTHAVRIILNAVPETLPLYRVTAKNTSSGENKIHDDATARRYGFRGALVPGVTVYAYLTEPLVAAFGAAWLQRGTATVRFHKPVLDGEELKVAAVVTGRETGRTAVAVTAATAAEPEAATLGATLPAGSPTPV